MAAVTAAVVGAGTAIYSANQAKKQQKDAQNFAREQMEGLDPFAEHRPHYADRLKKLVDDPSSIQDTATWRARLQAAERAMASQGYTGSGNALVAAADAGASAYQQEFENLGMLSGALQGQSARASAYGTAANANEAAAANRLGAIQGVGNSIVGLSGLFGNRGTAPTGATGGTAFGTGSVSGGTGWNVPVSNWGFGAPVNVPGGG